MSTVNFRANAMGRAAIWTGDDDAPFIDPIGNFERVKFHSDLEYVRIVREEAFALPLPDRYSATRSGTASYPVFDHGLAGIPFILGRIYIPQLAKWVDFSGSAPVQNLKYSDPNRSQGVRWLALGADATSVIVHEYYGCDWNGVNIVQVPAITLDIEVFVSNVLL